ncbi:MAG: xanthine dehydrogenase family protein subunit M [Planctomycetes bacterium]|nr:xanthine dehydrogenase family protein subunit M [Planctomycetota bacterium]
MKNFDWITPATSAEAVQSAAQAGRAFMGGGTDLLPLMKSGLREPTGVVSVARIPGMDRIELTVGGFSIGAGVTLATLCTHADVQRSLPAVADAARLAATPLVRNRATVGGNLCQRPRCWYFRHADYNCSKKGGEVCYAIEGENKFHAIFDNTTCNIVHPSNLAPAFWVHDGVIHVLGAKGERSIKLEDFWVRPEEDIRTEIALEAGELITAVSCRPLGSKSGSAFEEVNEKQSYDWGLVACAVRLSLDGDKAADARIVIGAVAPVPLRREAAEAVLNGKVPNEATAWAAADAAIAGATPLRDNAYKVTMLRACVKNAILAAAARARKS